MTSTNYFNIAAIKVFSDLYEFIKVDEMLQEYELNNNVIESKPKKQTKQINEDYKKFRHNITIESVILNQYNFEKINKFTPEKM